ncbi:DUF6896 domain-containing protein [Winogradskyella thalassocola]|uniref:DUF6896 domain-containing protein n=1 Tax=Winogradskyella thalassocola TaxID=262004 RepID=A0A1G8M328_9FLAO|nr:hypothetical protein [Winogradskyella thalassocola]SDI62359.1 hypothetical protein SAMN04489796_1169 [Winogradskyella thalassocola]
MGVSNYCKTFEKLNSIEKIILGVVIKFDSKANELINILGTEFNLDLSKEHPFSKLITCQNDLWKGSLPDNWIYQFHGSHCRFENKINNQILDIKINGGINYGIFNSSTLLWFIETTKEWKDVYKKIKVNEILTECLTTLEQENYIIDIGEFGYKSLIINNI